MVLASFALRICPKILFWFYPISNNVKNILKSRRGLSGLESMKSGRQRKFKRKNKPCCGMSGMACGCNMMAWKGAISGAMFARLWPRPSKSQKRKLRKYGSGNKQEQRPGAGQSSKYQTEKLTPNRLGVMFAMMGRIFGFFRSPAIEKAEKLRVKWRKELIEHYQKNISEGKEILECKK